MELAEALIVAAQGYVWIGIAVAAAFLVWGVDRIDPSARGAYLFRLLVLPGAIGLWPLVIWRWTSRPAPDGSDSGEGVR
jgi:hypothetical protein